MAWFNFLPWILDLFTMLLLFSQDVFEVLSWGFEIEGELFTVLELMFAGGFGIFFSIQIVKSFLL